MRTKIICLLVPALLSIAACNNQRTQSSQRSERQLGNLSAQDVKLNAKGLNRVGDSPPFDSPALTIQCVDEQACWINSPRILWRSLDGGRTWQEIYRISNDDDIMGCHFINRELGWMIWFHKLFETQDGGHTWSQYATPFEYPNGGMHSLWFLSDGKTGWLAGGLFRDQTTYELKSGVPSNAKDVTGKKVLEEAIYATRDGGLSWQIQLLPKMIGRILRIKFINKDQGIAFGERAIYYTVNGGANWQKATLKKTCIGKELFSEDYQAAPSNLFILDSATSWISYTDGRVLKSVDGGRTWCDLVPPGQIQFEQESNKPQYFTNLYFASSGHGWGLGWDRFLYETKDGGMRWARLTSEVRFDSIDFPNKANGFLVSEAGVFRIRL